MTGPAAAPILTLMPRTRKILTKARRRFITSLAKNLIVVVVAAAFGSDLVLGLSGRVRVVVTMACGLSILTLFAVGFWLAVDDEEGE